MSRNIIHVNNWAILGGMESMIIDFARTFPMFQHILCTTHPERENYEFIDYIRNMGIKYVQGTVNRDLVKRFNPFVMFLHNTKGEFIEGKWPYDWMKGTRIVGMHHAATWPLVPADMDYFVSNCIIRKYESCMDRIKLKVEAPPCVHAEDYMKIYKDRGKKLVVGRIQSQTCGDTNTEMMDVLNSIDNVEYVIVTKNPKPNTDRITYLPIKPGKMPEYLSKIDVFTMWSNRPETWSRVTTEAMLSSIPVIAFNRNDGLAEQVKRSGCGVLVNDAAGFKTAIEMFRDNEKLRQFYRNSKKWAYTNASDYTLKKIFMDKFLEWSHN